MFNRYYPDFEWSNKLWTHNIFRFLGMIFGERYGIRPSIAKIANQYGEIEVAFTVEAQLALFEVCLRGWFSKSVPFKVVVLQPVQVVGFANFGLTPYRFAIAYDNSQTAPFSATPGSWTSSFTTTGANLALLTSVYNGGNTSDAVSSVTYASVTMTRQQFNNASAITAITGSTLLGPATGANNIVVTKPGFSDGEILSVSYTGVDQTTGINITDSSGSPATTTCSVTLVTTVTGCWGVLIAVPAATPTASTNINATRIGAGTNFIIGDSNGSLGGAGSYTLTFTQSLSQNLGSFGVAIAPVAATGTTLQPRRGMMGFGI